MFLWQQEYGAVERHVKGLVPFELSPCCPPAVRGDCVPRRSSEMAGESP